MMITIMMMTGRVAALQVILIIKTVILMVMMMMMINDHDQDDEDGHGVAGGCKSSKLLRTMLVRMRGMMMLRIRTIELTLAIAGPSLPGSE